MFQLAKDEWDNLRSQIVISKNNQGGRRYLPYVFTEQGVAMLAAVLNSQKAIDVNIQIMRAFVQLRHYFSEQNAIEQVSGLRELLLLYIEENDKRVDDIIIALNNLIEQPVETKKIGFGVN